MSANLPYAESVRKMEETLSAARKSLVLLAHLERVNGVPLSPSFSEWSQNFDRALIEFEPAGIMRFPGVNGSITWEVGHTGWVSFDESKLPESAKERAEFLGRCGALFREKATILFTDHPKDFVLSIIAKVSTGSDMYNICGLYGTTASVVEAAYVSGMKIIKREGMLHGH